MYIRLKYLSGSFTGDVLFVGYFLSLVSSISRGSPAPSLIPPLWIQLPGLQSSWHSQCVPQRGRTLKKIRKAACHHPAAPPGLPRHRLLLSSRGMEQGALGAAATWDNVGGLVPSLGCTQWPFRALHHTNLSALNRSRESFLVLTFT